MGCGVSNKVSQARDPLQNLSGTVNINLKSAKLGENVTWIGAIEAYAIIFFGKKQYKSDISKIEGNEPQWNQQLTFPKISEDEMIYLEIWNDHQILDDQFLGSTAISLLEIRYGGEENLQLNLYDHKKQICGSVSVQLTFMCNYPSNPLAQKIDYAGFISIKITHATINRDQEIPSFHMNLLGEVKMNERRIGQTLVAVNEGQHPIWEDSIIAYREAGEDILEISIYDCNQQTEFELIGTSYISVCRCLSHADKKKVVIWWQGKSVGTLQVELHFYQTASLSNYRQSHTQLQQLGQQFSQSEDKQNKQDKDDEDEEEIKEQQEQVQEQEQESNLDQEWTLTTEQVYEQKQKDFKLQQEYDLKKIKQMKRACNRPELNLDGNEYLIRYILQTQFVIKETFISFKSIAISEYQEVMRWEDTPKEGFHTYTYKDGTSYIGDFSNHLRHGQGKFTSFSTQYCYDGQWKNDVFHGKGTLYIGKVEFNGQFSRGYIHGKCKIVYPKKQIIEANFRKGLYHGEVKIKINEQIQFQATYESGVVTQIQKKDEFRFPINSGEITTKGITQIYQSMAYDDSYDKEDIIPLNSLKKGLRMTCGKLFSKNMKYCLALTNRGTLKIISVIRQKEIWNNSYSDPNNRPYFFWINPDQGQFQVVSCYGVTFQTNTRGNNVIVVMRNTGICEIIDVDSKQVLQVLNEL